MLGTALTGSPLASAQAQKPVFKADVYVVPMLIWLRQGGKPDRGRTIEDFTVLLDGKPRALVDVKEDTDRPGYYFLNFAPPDEDRDGKNHRIEIKVTGHRSLKRTLKLPKRSKDGTAVS